MHLKLSLSQAQIECKSANWIVLFLISETRVAWSSSTIVKKGFAHVNFRTLHFFILYFKVKYTKAFLYSFNLLSCSPKYKIYVSFCVQFCWVVRNLERDIVSGEVKKSQFIAVNFPKIYSHVIENIQAHKYAKYVSSTS